MSPEDRQKWIALLNETIAHHERMIEYARKQPPADIPQAVDMRKQIQEDWFSDCCPLCRAVEDNCDECVLAQEYMRCSPTNRSEECSEWNRMAASKTWEEWLIHATALRAIMVKIREKLEQGVENVNFSHRRHPKMDSPAE